MAAGRLLHLALGGDRNTTVFAGRCKRVRFRKSGCRACADACPEAVISLDPGPEIGSGCTDCGLCRNACPTDAFGEERDTNRRMLDQARSLLPGDASPDEKKRLSIRCRQAGGGSGRSLVVPCLGSITENVLLGVAIAGFGEVRLTKGACAECRMKGGEGQFAQAAATAGSLLEAMGFRRLSLDVEELAGGNGQDEALTRREIFTEFSRKAKERAASFLHHREKDLRERIRDGLGAGYEAEAGPSRSRRREFLRGLIAPDAGDTRAYAHDPTPLPWKRMAVDETRCMACGTCHMLCPTGAVSGRTEDGIRRLFFNGSSCTNCFLCGEACPERAIDFREHLVLADLLDDKARIVAEAALDSCLSCGEGIPAGMGGVCPTCRRRWPETGRCADVPG